MSNSSAISEWPDVDALYRRFDALVRQPMRPIRRDAMAGVMRYFDDRCQGSKRLADAAQKVIPGGVKDGVVRSSIVSKIDCQPLSAAERKSVADPKYILPGVRSDGHVVWVPHFGKIFIGEVIIQRGYRRISMLRMELGCGTGGGGTVGGGEGNGGEIPPAP